MRVGIVKQWLIANWKVQCLPGINLCL